MQPQDIVKGMQLAIFQHTNQKQQFSQIFWQVYKGDVKTPLNGNML